MLSGNSKSPLQFSIAAVTDYHTFGGSHGATKQSPYFLLALECFLAFPCLLGVSAFLHSCLLLPPGT